MLKLVLPLVLLLSSIALSAQTDFTAAKEDQDLADKFLEKRRQVTDELIDGLDGEYKKEFKSIYKDRLTAIEQKVNYKHFLFNSDWNTLFEDIKDEIAANNPAYDFSNIDVVLAKYYWPNAFSMGDGTIAVNLGLLDHITTEDQLAFVLCHEFSHYLLEHTERVHLNNLRSQSSEEYQERIKQIKDSKYYQATQLKELIKDNLYAERRHYRAHEKQADSLAFYLYRNTKYNAAHCISTLQMLDSLNDLSYEYIDMYKALGLERIVRSSSSSGFIKKQAVKEVLDIDSVKTHPDCPERIAILKTFDPKANYELSTHNNSDAFNELMATVPYEMIESFMYFSQFDLALVNIQRMLSDQKNSEYLQSMKAYALTVLFDARREHRASEYASRLADFKDSSATELQEIIFKYSFSGLKDCSYYFCNDLYEKGNRTEHVIYCMYWFAKEFDYGDPDDLKVEYYSLYPNGKFNTYIN